jgi:hypothetical protein
MTATQFAPAAMPNSTANNGRSIGWPRPLTA